MPLLLYFADFIVYSILFMLCFEKKFYKISLYSAYMYMFMLMNGKIILRCSMFNIVGFPSVFFVYISKI